MSQAAGVRATAKPGFPRFGLIDVRGAARLAADTSPGQSLATPWSGSDFSWPLKDRGHLRPEEQRVAEDERGADLYPAGVDLNVLGVEQPA
jgi:hypothetical protein